MIVRIKEGSKRDVILIFRYKNLFFKPASMLNFNTIPQQSTQYLPMISANSSLNDVPKNKHRKNYNQFKFLLNEMLD